MPIRPVRPRAAAAPILAISPRIRKRPPSQPAANSSDPPSPHADPPGPAGEPASNDDGYKVGYGKPPKETRFKPGKSGNPNGRPKGAKGLHTIVKENLLATVPVRTSKGVRRMSKIQAIVQKQMELAMKGNLRAMLQLMNIYSAAVPEAPRIEPGDQPNNLTETDEAILAQFAARMRDQEGE